MKGIEASKECVMKSQQVYMMDPQKRSNYEEEMQTVRQEFMTPHEKELTREEVLKCVKLMEHAKFEAQQKMYELVRRQRLPPDAVN